MPDIPSTSYTISFSFVVSVYTCIQHTTTDTVTIVAMFVSLTLMMFANTEQWAIIVLQ